MDVNEFLNNASDKNAWFEISKWHWRAGRLLAAQSMESIPQPTGTVQRLDGDWLPDYVAYAVPAHLMYGYALETAIKATIIQDHPQKVEFEVSINGSSNIKNAKLKGFGAKNWHDLGQLAGAAGVFEMDFAQHSDDKWLRVFTDAIVWRSKYPVPKRSGDEEKRESLYAIKNAEKWLQGLHPEPIEQLTAED